VTARPFLSGLEPFGGTVALTGVAAGLAFLAPYLSGLVAALGALSVAAWMGRRARAPRATLLRRSLAGAVLVGVISAELLVLGRSGPAVATGAGLLLFGCLAALWWVERGPPTSSGWGAA